MGRGWISINDTVVICKRVNAMRSKSRWMSNEEVTIVDVLVGVRRTSDATIVVRGISFNGAARSKSVSLERRECVGPVLGSSVDANGGDGAVSGLLGPI